MCVQPNRTINLVSVRTTHFPLVNLVCVECYLISVREELQLYVCVKYYLTSVMEQL